MRDLFGNTITETDQRPVNPILIIPTNRTWWLRLRLNAPLSHHDPDNQDKSNKNLFRRMAKLVSTDQLGKQPTKEQVERVLSGYAVPIDIADLFDEITLPQFMAAALLYEFITRYGGGDGNGLFAGTERYRRLEERFQQSAVQAQSLFDLWGLACNSLQVGSIDHGRDENLLRLLNTPPSLAGLTLKALTDTPRPLVMLARLWVETGKQQSEKYAAKAGIAPASQERVVLHFDLPKENQQQQTVIEMPAFSANSLRHELIREPGMWHLFDSLGLAFDEPPPVTTAMFYNGGDIKSGASAPGDVFWLRKKICQMYPLLGLISGGTDSFILGESNLRIHSWVRCKENNDALSSVGLGSPTSVFEMVDEWTLTRHANRVDSGQMPYTFETLAANTEVCVRLSVTPYASQLQVGALMAALNTYTECDSTIGGQSARGFGLASLGWHNCQMDVAALTAYQSYLDNNKQMLRSGILDGTLATGKRVVSM